MKEGKGFIFFDKDTDFNGVIDASQLVLEGSVVGEAMASETVFLKHGSRFQGDINTKKLLAEEGATHKGNLRFTSTVERIKSAWKEDKPKEPEAEKNDDHEQMPSMQPEEHKNNTPQEPVRANNFTNRLW